jgi:pyruvate kinase
LVGNRIDEPIDRLTAIRDSLAAARDAMVDLEGKGSVILRDVGREHRSSARNLLHYIAMRREDLGELEKHLAMLGMSSLRLAGSNALATVNRLLELSDRVANRRYKAYAVGAPCDAEAASRLLHQHTRNLFGDRTMRIATMPSAAAHDYSLVHGFLKSGMGCMRIDCAREDRHAWRAMIHNLDKARVALKVGCVVLMDLPGANITTGAIELGPAVLKVRPSRDEYGRVSKPARLWIGDEVAGAPTYANALYVDRKWLSGIAKGDEIRCLDTRGRRRRMEVLDVKRGGVWVGSDRTAYLTNGTTLKRSGTHNQPTIKTGAYGIAAEPGRIRLSPGDTLTLSADSAPGRAARKNSAGHVLSPARISCSDPRALTKIKVGDRVIMDEGRISGIADASSGDEVHIRIQATVPMGAWLTSNASISLPDSVVDLPAIMSRDVDNLKFIVKHADLVGVPSINHESDIRALIDALREHTDAPPGILLTIANRHSYERLPAIILAAMRHPRFGVLIARNELAAAVNDQRLSDMEYEIRGLCEAAHCPSSSMDQAGSEFVWHRSDGGPPGASKLARAFETHREPPQHDPIHKVSHRPPSSRSRSSRESNLEPISSGH